MELSLILEDQSLNTVIRKSSGYNYKKAFDKAKEHAAYHEEGLRLDIAYRIIEAMATHKISRVQLAKKLAVSPPYITKMLRGHANLSLESLAKIAFALDFKWQCVLIPRNADIGQFLLPTVNFAETEAQRKNRLPEKAAPRRPVKRTPPKRS